MSLIDRLIEPTKDYISFRDFLFHLSSNNNEPLYEVVTYLLHHDLNSIGFYGVDTNYKITRFEPFEFNSVTEFLKEVQKALEISACKWVFSSSESLDELIQSDRRLLTTTFMKAMQSYFKKSELLSFKLLDGLLHFDAESIADADSNSVCVEQQLDEALEKIDRLMQSLADSNFLIGTLTLGHNEQLAAANAKIKQQEQDIKKLNEQLNKKADTGDILSDRNEKSYQTTIGLLLELMTIPKVESVRPPFTSEAVIIGRITDKSIYGQGKTTLETRFRDAKITLEQTKKKAFKP
ncbi:coiled-coil domain-containing protein [uncultured Psychrobacter sp.]|uniref:coiled-coil domain-containing protein n=1 Tax=uncultured Psychrobacter sp. TaxID=259303 RepID=UPI003459935F